VIISNTPKPNLLIILGPTAVGKTELSIKLAHTLQGEVISADSRLFYRGMNIGTAKPTKDEMDGIPHHLIDVAAPDESWSLSVFKENAER
jgi:tRNA dimethylallyltransferase